MKPNFCQVNNIVLEVFILKGVTGDFIGHSAQVFILKGVKWGREAVERWKVRREFDSMYTRQSITKCRYCQYQLY